MILQMPITRPRITKALDTPGKAVRTPAMICLRDLIRLKSRNTLNALNSLRTDIPGMSPSMDAQEIITMAKSKIFHVFRQKGQKKFAYKFIKSSARNKAFKQNSKAVK